MVGGMPGMRAWRAVVWVAVVVAWGGQPLGAQEGSEPPALTNPPEGAALQPTGRIEIHVPPEVPVERLSRWTLELDDVDVTALLSREGELAVFTPPQALVPGVHDLRIVETTPAGALVELASWRFRVAADEDQQVRFDGGADLQGGGLIAHNNTGDEPAPGFGQGSGDAALTAEGAGWRLRAEGTSVLDTRRRLTPNGTIADVDEFLMGATAWSEAGSATVEAGHTTPATDSMIMAQYYNRRGLALTLSDTDESVVVRPFAVRTERIAGLRHGLGISDPDNRTIGGTATVHPLERQEWLGVQATVLTGSGRGEGIGQVSPLDPGVGGTFADTTSRGTAGSMRFTSTLFDRRLSLDGEIAATSYDFGGSASASRDYGYRVDLRWDSQPGGGYPESGPAWSAGLRQERRGLFFRSPAEPFAGQDFSETSLFGRVGWPSIELTSELTRIVDNVDDKEFLPTVRSQGWRGGAYWSPHAADPEAEPGWLGTPTFRINGQVFQDLQIETPRSFVGDPINRLERSVGVGGTFNYSDWSWDISHRIGYIRDQAAIGNRLVNYSQLNLSFPVGESVYLSPYAQYSFDANRSTGVDQDTINLGLFASISLVPGVLRWDTSYAYDASSASNGTVDFAIHTVDSALSWTVAQPEGNRPGVTLSLRGAYNHSDERGTSFAEGHSYEVFGVLSVGLQGEL